MENPFGRMSMLDSKRGRIRHDDIPEIILALEARRVNFLMDRSVEGDKLAIHTAEVLDRFKNEFQSRH